MSWLSVRDWALGPKTIPLPHTHIPLNDFKSSNLLTNKVVIHSWRLENSSCPSTSWDIELVVYLTNVMGLLQLVQDLRITHEQLDRRSDPSIHDHLHYPNDVDGPLNVD